MERTSQFIADQLIGIIGRLVMILPINPNLNDKRRKVRLRKDLQGYIYFSAVSLIAVLFLLCFKKMGQGVTDFTAYLFSVDSQKIQLDDCIKCIMVFIGDSPVKFINYGYSTVGHLTVAIIIPYAIRKLFDKFQEVKKWRKWGYYGFIQGILTAHLLLKVLGAINPILNDGLLFQILNTGVLIAYGIWLGIIFIKQDHFKENQELKIQQAELEKTKLEKQKAILEAQALKDKLKKADTEITKLTPFVLNTETDSFVVSTKMWTRYRPNEAGVSNKSVLIKHNQYDMPLKEDSFRNRTLESIEIVAPFFRVHDSFIVNENRITAVIGPATNFYIVVDGWFPIKSTKRSLDQYSDALKCQRRPTEKTISLKYEELLRNSLGENIEQFKERAKSFDSILNAVFSLQKRLNDI